MRLCDNFVDFRCIRPPCPSSGEPPTSDVNCIRDRGCSRGVEGILVEGLQRPPHTKTIVNNTRDEFPGAVGADGRCTRVPCMFTDSNPEFGRYVEKSTIFFVD